MATTKEEETYKKLKEAFVSNHTGGTITEINLVTAIAPISYILFAALQSRTRLFTTSGPAQFTLDFFINCIAVLLACTLYSHQPLLLDILVLSPAVLICLLNPTPRSKVIKPPPSIIKVDKKDDASANPLPKKPFLTVYRSSMMAITCAAILAVDFRVFPRRFAKVENWGTSLMDLGVGSFVFSAGLVAARTIVKQHIAGITTSLSGRMKGALRSSIPLLILGFVRLAMVKGVDYAEHVTEYGVHWNFFFTLGLLPPFVALLQSAPGGTRSPTMLYTTLTLAVAGGYQAVLVTTGLQEYVLIGDRKAYGLLGMNKEGAASFIGYLAIFLSGMATGTYVLPRDTSVKPTQSKMLRQLLAWSAFWIITCAATNSYHGLGIGISRRLANLPYVLWIAAFNTSQLVAFYLVEKFFFSTSDTLKEGEAYKFAVPPVLEAFNRNGLATFLIANLLTGLVNVSLKTLEMGRETAMGVLGAYMLVIAGVAVGLDRANMSIKL
ncbi:GWT1-domain-containing protein [Geopyxis carbonaria]|nr:GWT1-domain-containing protein [Geopyxis carbonaria]